MSAAGTVAPSTAMIRAARKVTNVAGRGRGYSSIHPGRTVPAPILSINSHARASAVTGASGSAPRSNRYEASVDRPSRRLVRRTDFGRNQALSMAIVLVRSLTSEAAPPMTPAIPVARSASAMTSMSASSARSCPSSVRTRSPGFGSRTRISRPESLA